jgi:hypothetical protein
VNEKNVKNLKLRRVTIPCNHEGRNLIVQAKQRLNRDGPPTVFIVVREISKKGSHHKRLVTIKCPVRATRDLGCALEVVKNCLGALGALGLDCLPRLLTEAQHIQYSENKTLADIDGDGDSDDDGVGVGVGSPQNIVRKLIEWYRARRG